ncbi:MAG: hypothetical protein JSV33_04935 [bacterium]|nr:MAG: hypothetical protein JSV33_04935 [bacterium]
MKTVSSLILLVVFVFILVFSCELEKDDSPEPSSCRLTDCPLDFGSVIFGNARDMYFEMENRSDGTKSWELKLDCDDFNFIDVGPDTIIDTLFVTLASHARTQCYVRFEPQELGERSCELTIADCGVCSFSGIGIFEIEGFWSQEPSGVSVDLYDVWGCGEAVHACGDSGTVLVQETPLSNWEVLASHAFDDIPLRSVWYNCMGILWVAGGDWYAGGGKVLKFRENMWTTEDEDYMMTRYNVIWGHYTGEHYFLGLGMVSTGGYNGKYYDFYYWNLVEIDTGLSEITGVFGSLTGDRWVVLNQSWNNLYYGEGTTWENRTEPWMDQNLQDVWVHAQGQAFAVGTNGAIYYYDGASWNEESIAGLARTFYGVWGYGSSQSLVVFAVGEGALIYCRRDGNWEEHEAPSGVTEDLYSVSGRSYSDVHAVGANGTIIRYQVYDYGSPR